MRPLLFSLLNYLFEQENLSFENLEDSLVSLEDSYSIDFTYSKELILRNIALIENQADKYCLSSDQLIPLALNFQLYRHECLKEGMCLIFQSRFLSLSLCKVGVNTSINKAKVISFKQVDKLSSQCFNSLMVFIEKKLCEVSSKSRCFEWERRKHPHTEHQMQALGFHKDSDEYFYFRSRIPKPPYSNKLKLLFRSQAYVIPPYFYNRLKDISLTKQLEILRHTFKGITKEMLKDKIARYSKYSVILLRKDTTIGWILIEEQAQEILIKDLFVILKYRNTMFGSILIVKGMQTIGDLSKRESKFAVFRIYKSKIKSNNHVRFLEETLSEILIEKAEYLRFYKTLKYDAGVMSAKS